MKEVHKKLFKAKKEIGKLSKDSKNPFFKSNYLSLNGLIEAITDVLNDNDLLLLQPIEDNKVSSQIIDIDTGTLVESSITLPLITDPQKLGSAITYFRRYTLESLLGLKADDDDGNTASQKPTQDRKKSLTKVQFEATKKGTKEQIKVVLNTFRMSDDERKELERLV